MGSERNFFIGILEHDEAWDLFSTNAGKCIEDLKLEDIARKIAEECDGLSIAIVTIATALKDKPRGVWNDSLRQLQNSNLQRVSGMEKVYSRIQLSYDLLKDKEARSCFLLCCLCPEDAQVSPDFFVFYGKGLGFFENVDSISEASDRVEAIPHKLKKTFLLLDGEQDGSVKMHDVIRDFAISISSNSHLVRHSKEMTKWPETNMYENYSAISLMFGKVDCHPVGLRCPKLQLLRLIFGHGSAELPIGFFEGMKELKVLVLQVPLLLQSLGMLKQLRALIIMETSFDWDNRVPLKIGDLLGHCDLKYLERFSLVSERPCNDFPVEIGLLCNLRFPEFRNIQFEYMPPGVLSKLVKLEELSLTCEFMSWGCKEDDKERVNARLDEIEALPLTTLQIGIKEGSSFGEKFVKNLKRFVLFIGGNRDGYEFKEKNWRARMDVFDVEASIVTMSWMICLLAKTEYLKLKDVRDLKNLMLLPRSLQLRMVKAQFCQQMECFVNSTTQAPYFSNLNRISINGCSKLKYVFPLSVAIELKQLQTIHISDCDEIQQVFFGNIQIVEETVPIVTEIMFPQLKEVLLEYNSKLEVFYGGNEAIELPSFEELIIDECENVQVFSYGFINAPKLMIVFLHENYYSENGVEDLNAYVNEWWKTEKHDISDAEDV